MGYKALGYGLALLLAGGMTALAWREGLYATVALSVLVGGWSLIAQWRGASRPGSAPLPPPPATAPAADAQERRRLMAYLNLSPAPLVTLAPSGRPHAANRAARKLFGTDDAIGDAGPGTRDTLGETLARAMTDTPPGRSASVVLATPHGPRSFALLTADVAVAGSASRIAALLDIEGELRAAGTGALRDMLQVLGHELRNTLTPIASLSQSVAAMLDDARPDLAQIRDAMATIARRASGLQRFSEGYAALARLPPPALARTDIGKLAEDLARLFQSRWPDTQLERDFGGVIGYVRVDADQISAALWAVLQNSAEAVAAQPTRRVRFSASMEEAGARFTIADSGPGVPAARLDAVFQPFFTTKPEGSGIGLALARQIFRAHGGALEIMGGSGAGEQLFVATLPGLG